MKYIRTKDGIKYFYNIEQKGDGYFFDYSDGQIEGTGFKTIEEWNKMPFINTIEELCDEFVIEYPDGEKDTLNYDFANSLRSMGMEQYNMELKHNWCKLYGAIWTDKGLIYVAKMNDKGELELL